MEQVLITFLIITIPIGFAYYLDYKKNKKYFIESLKNLSGLLKYMLISILTFVTYKFLIPINIENDTEFNTIRLKNGLEIINNKNFKKIVNDQYTTEWWRKGDDNIYFKKVIDYNLLGPETETDYYKLSNIDHGYLFKTYSFLNNNLNYFIEKPEGVFSKVRTRQIRKEKFNEYLKK
ncbi:MAG: hypothetical protein HYR91_00170 [Flavobacteriia bacterium]|nr:hypothetical protein [Flavobacteriia bacterium]